MAVSFWIRYGGAPRVLYQWVLVVGSVGIASCLQLGVFYEIVNTLILPRSPLKTVLRHSIRWATAATILLAATIPAAFSAVGLQTSIHIFQVLNFSTNLINLGLLLVLFMFTRAFHISWKSLSAGVALGFGITSSIKIGAASLIFAFGMKSIVPGDIVRMLGYLACTIVWLIYIFRHEASSQYSGQSAEKLEIESWSQELRNIVGGDFVCFSQYQNGNKRSSFPLWRSRNYYNWVSASVKLFTYARG